MCAGSSAGLFATPRVRPPVGREGTYRVSELVYRLHESVEAFLCRHHPGSLASAARAAFANRELGGWLRPSSARPD